MLQDQMSWTEWLSNRRIPENSTAKFSWFYSKKSERKFTIFHAPPLIPLYVSSVCSCISPCVIFPHASPSHLRLNFAFTCSPSNPVVPTLSLSSLSHSPLCLTPYLSATFSLSLSLSLSHTHPALSPSLLSLPYLHMVVVSLEVAIHWTIGSSLMVVKFSEPNDSVRLQPMHNSIKSKECLDFYVFENSVRLLTQNISLQTAVAEQKQRNRRISSREPHDECEIDAHHK